MKRANATTSSLPTITTHLGLVVLAALAAAAAWALGGGDSFWIDEVSSVEMAARGTSSPLTLLAFTGVADVHPPGYYLLLSAWGALFGLAETSVRGLSALLFAAAVFGTGRLAWRTGRAPAGALAAAALFAGLPAALHYGVEVRSYALLLALTVANAGALLSLLERRATRGRVATLAVALAAGMLTGYSFLPIAVGVVIAGVLGAGRDRHTARGVVLAGVVAAGLFGPWVPSLLYQLLNLPPGFTAHLRRGPAALDVLAASGPAANLLPAWAARVGGGLFAVFGLTGATLALLRSGSSSAATLEAHDDSESLPRADRRVTVLVTAGACAFGALGAAVLAGLLPLPGPLADLYATRAPSVAAVPLLVLGGGLALEWLARAVASKGGRAAAPALATLTLTATAVVALLSLTGTYLMVRTALPLLPLLPVCGVTASGGTAGDPPRASRRVRLGALAVGAALLALSALSAGMPDRVAPRPDLRGAAEGATTLQSTVGGPLLVLPRWEAPGLKHYRPETEFTGVDNAAEVSEAVRRTGSATIVLGRWAVPLYETVRAEILAGLGPGAAIREEGRTRGFRWLAITTATGDPR